MQAPPVGNCTNNFFSLLHTATSTANPRPPPPGYLITPQNQHLPLPPPTYTPAAVHHAKPLTDHQYTQAYTNMSQFIGQIRRVIAMITLTNERYNRFDRTVKEQSKNKLFNDNTAAIQQLTSEIKLEIQTLHTTIEDINQQIQLQLKNIYNANPKQQRPHDIFHKLAILNDIQTQYKSLTELFSTTLQDHQKSLTSNLRSEQFEHERTINNQYQKVYDNFASSICAGPTAPPAAPQSTTHVWDQTEYNNANSDIRQRNQQQSILPRKNTSQIPQIKNSRYSSKFASDLEDQLSDNESIGLLHSSMYNDRNIKFNDKNNFKNENNSNWDPELQGLSNFNHNNDPDDLIGFSLVQQQERIQASNKVYEESTQTDQYYSARQQSMLQIRDTLQDLAGMFTKLTELVHQQEETVMRIDNNTEIIGYNVDAAGEQINQLYDTTANNQWLLIKMFAIIIIFAILFVTIIS